jgi:hypothetical protein
MTFREGDVLRFGFSLKRDGVTLDFSKGAVVSSTDPTTSVLIGVAKGMRQVLMERDLWQSTMKADCKAGIRRHSADGRCCATGALLACEDFNEAREVSHLKEIIEDPARHPDGSQPHVCLFLPKVGARNRVMNAD